MSLFEWKDEYSVGVPQIDAQHKKLVALINSLDETLSAGFDLEALKPIFNELVEYTVYHFTFEERLMRDQDYGKGDREAHIRQHRQFEEQIKALRADLDQLKVSDCEVILSYLTNWLVNHICKIDHKLGQYLLQHSGVAVSDAEKPIAALTADIDTRQLFTALAYRLSRFVDRAESHRGQIEQRLNTLHDQLAEMSEFFSQHSYLTEVRQWQRQRRAGPSPEEHRQEIKLMMEELEENLRRLNQTLHNVTDDRD